jgi:TonB-dependent SusC/RagA subfamily outer membrane receptor
MRAPIHASIASSADALVVSTHQTKSTMSKLHKLLAIVFMGLVSPMTAIAQGRGVIAGQVTGQGGAPLAGARVTVTGTSLRALTGDNGTYRITNVPAGPTSVTAQMLGYSPRTQRVTVPDGGIVTANFALEQAPLQITGVVVTATGREESTREIGSSVGHLETANVPLAATPTASDLLAGKVTGVVVTQSSGTTGGGSRVRIRGANSMSLSNAPLIIVDGIRVESSEISLGPGVGGQSPSRLDDLNPNDIESIDVLKGPAAAALYGTAAANGVIQVTTKRGQAGRSDFRVWTESGRLSETGHFPNNVLALDASGNLCSIVLQSQGRCSVATTYTSNPLEDPATSPFQRGSRQAVGGSVSGGAEVATYYLSSSYQQEQGVLPQNQLQRMQVQANTTGRIGDRLNVGANVSYLTNRMELPLSDNALFGIIPMGVYGYPDPATIAASQGYANDPAFFYDWKTYQNYARITGAVRGEYHPISWLSLNGNAGIDRYAREDRNRIPRQSAYSSFGSVYTHGYIDNFTYDINDLTTNASATGIFDLRPGLVSTTAVGSQYIRENLHRIEAFGAGLIPGVETSLAGATSDYSVSEVNTRTRRCPRTCSSSSPGTIASS